jgi:hypothetical protein
MTLNLSGYRKVVARPRNHRYRIRVLAWFAH